MSDISLSHCTAECFVSTKCEVFGYTFAGKKCYLYDDSFAVSTAQSCSGNTVSYYRVTCGQLATYTYVSSLKKCLSYKSDQRMVWEDARDACRDEGGHLVYVKTQEILDYIIGHRETENTKYWVGGKQTELGSNVYEWLSGETIDSTNGGQLWLPGRPKFSDPTSEYCILTREVDESFVLIDSACNTTRKFFCELDNF
ncbi:layilin-like [Mercenaria mercenaria]|uniref:layilin-like n=1 Tax=Mercenaria mercenaria TaxID=6596 RepID=UPI00234EDBB2|nr:layilin-like [Mercenaria mercenaria]